MMEYQYTNGNPFFCLCEHDALVLAQHENGIKVTDFDKAVETLDKRGKVRLNENITLERL